MSVTPIRHAWKNPPGYGGQQGDTFIKAKPVGTTALHGNLYEAMCGARVPWDSLCDNEFDTTCPRCNEVLWAEIIAEANTPEPQT